MFYLGIFTILHSFYRIWWDTAQTGVSERMNRLANERVPVHTNEEHIPTHGRNTHYDKYALRIIYSLSRKLATKSTGNNYYSYVRSFLGSFACSLVRFQDVSFIFPLLASRKKTTK